MNNSKSLKLEKKSSNDAFETLLALSPFDPCLLR